MARQLVITQNITLDGVVENDGTWFNPTEDSDRGRDLAAVTAEHAADSDAFLVGRTTFEEMRAFWPQQRDDPTGVTDHLNQVAKYVVSSHLQDPGWPGTSVLRGGNAVPDEIHALTDAPGRDIVVTGSLTLTSQLLREDLVDELRLFVYPVVLGHGRRLFPQNWAASRLQLLEQRPIHDVMLLRYRIPC